MNDDLREIKDLIFKIIKAKYRLNEICGSKYRCKHYDSIDEELFEIHHMIDTYKNKLICKLNEYIGVINVKVGMFTLYSKENKITSDTFWGDIIHIINNDSKEYYCVKCLLDNLSEKNYLKCLTNHPKLSDEYSEYALRSCEMIHYLNSLEDIAYEEEDDEDENDVNWSRLIKSRSAWINQIKEYTGEVDDWNVIQYSLSYTLQSLKNDDDVNRFKWEKV